MVSSKKNAEKDSEIANITIGGKANFGELVLFNDRLELYMCEQKSIHILPPTNLRFEKIGIIPLNEVRHITYNKGLFPLTSPRVELFLTEKTYNDITEKFKKRAGIFGFMVEIVHGKNENKLKLLCRRVPSQIVQAFVDKTLKLLER